MLKMMQNETTAFIISHTTSINKCIVTHHRLDVPGFDTRGGEILPTHPDWHWVIRSFPGEKRPGRGFE
jgi:hypothetical protein